MMRSIVFLRKGAIEMGKFVDTIKKVGINRMEKLLSECREEAVREGADPETWKPTEADLDWIVDQLGFKPTREEWKKAGLEWVGGQHCSQ